MARDVILINAPVPGNRAWVIVDLVAAVVGILALGTSWSGWIQLRAGEHNWDMPSVIASVCLDGVWFICLAVQMAITAKMLTRPARLSSRFLCVILLVLSLFGCPASMIWRGVLPEEAYMHGVQRWAQQNVDAQAIGRWYASVPVTPAPVSIAPASRPNAIAKLGASNVIAEANGEGVMLEWNGYPLRKVFVAVRAVSAPPTTQLEYWTQASSNVYVIIPMQRP